MDWKHYENIAKEVKRLEENRKANTPPESPKNIHGDCDYVWAPEKGGATIIYILVMFFGAIFNDRILIWIVASLIYFNFIGKYKK